MSSSAARALCRGLLSQKTSLLRSQRVSVYPKASRAWSTTTTRQSPATAVQRKPIQSIPITHPSRIEDRQVAVDFDSNQTTRFHHLWLRDHCRCPECFHPITKQRLVNTFEIPLDVQPERVESHPDGLEVHWTAPSQHTSLYPWAWLKQHSYDPPLRCEVNRKLQWGAEIKLSPPTVAYDEIMASDQSGLYKWLSAVDEFGFCFVSGVPVSTEATEELSTKIGFIRETQYGKFWEFTSDLTRGDTAYTTMALGAHTDNTYFTDPCGLQLFHLLSHTDGTGGATLLVDGFNAAQLLKSRDPKAYETLSRIGVPAHAAGEETSIYTPSPQGGYPILGHHGGKLVQVRWNNDDRSVMDNLKSYELEEWYRAIRIWHSILISPSSEYWIQLTPGTAVVVDNHRVLHGRSAFDGKRRMCGAYIGIDEYRSKLALLREKFAPSEVESRAEIINGRSVWSSHL